MRKQALLSLLLLSCFAANAQPSCVISTPQGKDEAAKPITWEARAHRLAHLPAGEVVFRTSQMPEATIHLKRLKVNGISQWDVRAVPDDGSAGWAWQKRWGLPAISVGAPGHAEATIVKSLFGEYTVGGLEHSWNWLLITRKDIENKYADGRLDPQSQIQGFNEVRYSDWNRIHEAGLRFPGELTLLDHSISNRDETTLYIESVRLLPPNGAQLGWPMPVANAR